MKQIIVNVADLTIEEKQRVNEALAKIQNIHKIENVTTGMAWFYGPSSFDTHVGWNSILKRETPTHTPQQVLEMAGMVPSANQYVFLANALIITDSSGNIIYDSTPEEKKNGHVHAELIAQYAEDAKTTDKPWELWQVKWAVDVGVWVGCRSHPMWENDTEYRRKPKTKLIHGTEVPDLSFTPLNGEDYYYICLSSDQLVKKDHHSKGCLATKLRAIRGLCYPYTGEGKQAAILHAEALLNID